MSLVSVIIVNLNTKDLLRDCLASVRHEASRISLEVLVIDNGSVDGSVEMIRKEFPLVRLFVNSSNEGFAAPNNRGMKEATGDFVFLLNSDTVVKPGAIEELLNFMKTTDDAGACGPRLVYPDGSLQKSVKGFPTLWTHACDMFGLDRLLPNSRVFGKGEAAYFDYDATAEVEHVMAAAFLVRTEVVSQVGMLDERFRIYYNDMDWCYRMKQSSWKIYYVPTAQVVHYLGRTVAQVNRDFSHFQELHNNVMLFYQKHYGRWSILAYKLLLCSGFSLRVVIWSVKRILQSSPETDMMFRYSWKTFLLGLTFWIPLRETT